MFNVLCSKKTFLMVVFLLGIVLVGTSMAQDISAITSGVRKLNYTLFRLLVNITTVVLFLTGIWQLVEGYMQHQLSSKWMSLLGIGVFIVALRAAPSLYALLVGTNKTQFIDSTGGPNTIFTPDYTDTGAINGASSAQSQTGS